MVLCYIQDTCWGQGSYPSTEMQLVYYTAPANWALKEFDIFKKFFFFFKFIFLRLIWEDSKKQMS